MNEQPNPTPHPLHILCNNVHRTNDITHSILSTLIRTNSTVDIVIITEPWIGTIRSDTQEKGTVNHNDWICLTPPQITNAGVTLYYKKHSNLRIVPLLHYPYANDHVLPVRITKPDFELTLIAVYNPPSSFAATKALTSFDIPETPTILCGDFNLHAHDWDSKVTNTNAQATIFLDWLMDNELRVLNDPDIPTYHGHAFQHNTVIDLVFANKSVTESYDLSPIQVHTEDHFASDHYPISFQITTYSPSTEPNRHPKLSKNKKDEWINTIRPRIDQIMLSSPDNPTPQQIDIFAAKLVVAISSTTDQITKTKKQKPSHTKHWWNDDLTNTLSELRQLAKTTRHSRNPYLANHYKRTKAVFRAKVKHAKRNWANEKLEGATSKTVWDFIRWYSHRGKRYRPLYTSPSNVPAEDDEERSNRFTQQFFPEPPPTQPFVPSDEPHTQRVSPPLTTDEINYAITHCKTKSTPGPSGINYTAVKWMWDAFPETLTHLYSACIETRHYPTPFKHSITSVVPKPNKKDYQTPSAYRPIQLTECIGKVLEKIMARRIQYEVANDNIVPLSQFGGRIHSSTIDAGLAFVQDVHDAWQRKEKASALFFDITGFFNFVNHEGLIDKMRHYGFNAKTTSLIQSFLQERTTSFTYDNFTSERIHIRNGIPQGSPLSPILSIIYSSELTNLRQLIKRQIISFAYIDDGTLLTTSSSLDINVERLQSAFDTLTRWLTANGLQVQPEKVELMHFTKGPDKSSPPLRLPNQRPITAPKTIRWLGFHLDRHLTFVEHTKILAARATATARAMKILGNTVRGMSHVHLRQLSLSTIVPILTYGCQLWWGNRCSNANTKRLQTSLNLALRIVCRAFRTSPIPALQYISHIPPLKYIVHKTCFSSSIRFHRLLPLSPVLLRIPNHTTHDIRLRHGPKTIRLKTPSSTLSPLQRIARLTNATNTPSLNPILNAPWESLLEAHPRVSIVTPPPKDKRDEHQKYIIDRLKRAEMQLDTLVIGTDGSRKRKRTGAGIIIQHGATEVVSQAYGIGRKTNNYDGESFALTAGMKIAHEYCHTHPEITHIIFVSDSSTAITNVTRTHAHPTQSLSRIFTKHAKEFLNNDTHHISLLWTKSHQGTRINEEADRLAKQGRRVDQYMHPPSLSYYAEKRSSYTQKQWRKDFAANHPNGAFGEVTFHPPTTKPVKAFHQLANDPEVFGRLTQIRTMHGYNPPYYHRFHIDRDLSCACGIEFNPADISFHRRHVLNSCDEYITHHHILAQGSRARDPTILLGSTKGLLAVAKFLKTSGAFTRDGQPYHPPRPPDLPEMELHIE